MKKLTCFVIAAVMLFSFAGCTRQSDADAIDTTKDGVIGSGITGETKTKSTNSGAAAYGVTKANRKGNSASARTSRVKANSRLGDASFSYRSRTNEIVSSRAVGK